MLVAKLSTDKIVQVLKGPQSVLFAPGQHILVCDRLTRTPSRIEPYWVQAESVVWKMEFADKNQDGSTFPAGADFASRG